MVCRFSGIIEGVMFLEESSRMGGKEAWIMELKSVSMVILFGLNNYNIALCPSLSSRVAFPLLTRAVGRGSGMLS